MQMFGKGKKMAWPSIAIVYDAAEEKYRKNWGNDYEFIVDKDDLMVLSENYYPVHPGALGILGKQFTIYTVTYELKNEKNETALYVKIYFKHHYKSINAQFLEGMEYVEILDPTWEEGAHWSPVIARQFAPIFRSKYYAVALAHDLLGDNPEHYRIRDSSISDGEHYEEDIEDRFLEILRKYYGDDYDLEDDYDDYEPHELMAPITEKLISIFETFRHYHGLDSPVRHNGIGDDDDDDVDDDDDDDE